jgi:autotransporter-associated beta strand protein
MWGAVATTTAALVVMGFTPDRARAGNTWDGGAADDQWTSAGNWDPDGAPANTGMADVTFAGVTRLTPDLNSNYMIRGLVFASGGGSFTLGSSNGSALTIGSDGLVHNSTAAQTIAHDVALSASQTWNVAGGGSLSLTGQLSGSGTLTKSGTGTLTLGGTSANTISGPVLVAAGTLVLAKPAGVGALAGTLLEIGDGNVLNTTRVNQNSANQIPDNATVRVRANGNWALQNGVSETIGQLEMFGGQVYYTDTSDVLTIAPGGSITSWPTGNGSNIVVTLNLSGAAVTVDVPNGLELANITNGSVIKTGAGVLRMSGLNNTFNGFTANAGTVLLSSSSSNVLGTGPVALAGGVRVDPYFGSRTLSNPITLGGAVTIGVTGTSYDLTFGGAISGSGGLIKMGANALILAGNSTYSGGTNVTGGTLTIGHANAAGTGTITLAGGVTLRVLSVAAPVPNDIISSGSGNFLNDVSHGSVFTFSGVIGGTAPLALKGFGNMHLGGTSPNTLSGTLSVDDADLVLEKPAGVDAIAGDLDLGNDIGNFPNNVFLDQTADNVIKDTVNVRMRNDVTWLLSDGNRSETIATLAMTGGLVQTGNGVLTIGNGLLTAGASSLGAAVAGNLRLAAAANQIDVSDGAAAVDLDVSNLIATGSVTKTGAGLLRIGGVGALSGDLHVSQGVAALQSSFTARLATLAIDAGARLDVGAAKFAVTNATDIGSWTGSNYTGITGLIASGRNGGAWNGSGIVTSQSQAAAGNLTSIGVATASQVKGIASTATAVFAGQTVSGSDTLVMYTYGGDANLDGKLNVDDYGRIDSNIGLGTAGWYNGDFNYDGKINIDDFGIIDSNVGTQGPPFSAGIAATDLRSAAPVARLSAIPEPGVGWAVVSVTLAFASRRRAPVPHQRLRPAYASSRRPRDNNDVNPRHR